jgi:hypothetical protein
MFSVGSIMPGYSQSSDLAQELGLENEFTLLVLLTRLECLVVLPAHGLLALLAVDIAHDVATRCHIPLTCFPLGDVDDAIEEVGFAMLAAEVLCTVCIQYRAF